jgi:hypothetical protein
MVFKPAPFIPMSGQKVAWYRLFGRSAAGSNVKARLSDYSFRGLGDEVLFIDWFIARFVCLLFFFFY